MKKANLLLAGALLLSLGWAAAQVCTPDPQYTGDGIYPPCPMDTAFTGQAYSYIITVNVPADTTINPFGTIAIDSLKITNVNGLPTGLTNYQCSPPSCTWLGGTSGCILISGTPSQTGTFPLQANTTVYTSIFDPPVTYNYCTLIVATPVLIREFSGEAKMHRNTPNPFSRITTIEFNSQIKSVYNFKVYDLLGNMIFTRKINAVPGANTFEFSAKGLLPGIYFYSLESNGNTETRRMTVVTD
ncbi:MAG: T9SS type A sorting domain-containing protein [Bacteroidetes bacterium]|nr:T9SS type A sorting domain-containing protein [Bacteroidota bacterium]